LFLELSRVINWAVNNQDHDTRWNFPRNIDSSLRLTLAWTTCLCRNRSLVLKARQCQAWPYISESAVLAHTWG